MSDFLASAETVQHSAVSMTSAQSDYEFLNKAIKEKIITAIIRRQKMEYSILHFGEFSKDWLICEVEDLQSTGEPLLIVVPRKATPVTFYFN